MKKRIALAAAAVILFMCGWIAGGYGKNDGQSEKKEKKGTEIIASSIVSAEAGQADDVAEQTELIMTGTTTYWDYELENFLTQTDEATLYKDSDLSLDMDSLTFEASFDGQFDQNLGAYNVNVYSLRLQLISVAAEDVGKQVTISIPLPDILTRADGKEERSFTVTAAVSSEDAPVYTECDGVFERKEKIEGVSTVWRTEEGQTLYTKENVRIWQHQYYVSKWEPEILSEYQSDYQANHDMIGWLSIDGSSINGPVMQTLEDEEYYLHRDFNGNDSEEGTLFVSAFCDYGVGLASNNYEDGEKPTTNCIIYGHNMKNGSMFGTLDQYQSEAYEKEHSLITFNTLYETRTYQVMCVFRSQIYDDSCGEDVFRYYAFYQADTEEEFNDWYENIRALSLYDTGVTAELGDEFITLSTCAYHVKNGRFAVVAKRIK